MHIIFLVTQVCLCVCARILSKKKKTCYAGLWLLYVGFDDFVQTIRVSLCFAQKGENFSIVLSLEEF